MTEDEAIAWIRERWGDAKAALLARFADMLCDEARIQNLVAESTVSSLWSRHIVDSAQLAPCAPATGAWVDIGTGGGFPGMVIAALRPEHTCLVEPRRLRADFLERAAQALGLANVCVIARTARAAALPDKMAVVSARAVAPLNDLLSMQQSLGSHATVGVFPRGRRACDELAEARATWDGVFHVKQSVTDAEAKIVVVNHLRRK